MYIYCELIFVSKFNMEINKFNVRMFLFEICIYICIYI